MSRPDPVKGNPNRQRWIDQARGSYFYGKPVGEFDQEDLLMMVGHLMEARERDRGQHSRDLSLMADLGRPGAVKRWAR